MEQQDRAGQLLTATTHHLVGSIQTAAIESSSMVAASVHAALPCPMDAQMHTPPTTPRQIMRDGFPGPPPVAPIRSRPRSSPGEGSRTPLGALQQLGASIARASR